MVYDYSLTRVSILDADGRFGRSMLVVFGRNYWAQGVLGDSLVFLASPGEGGRPRDISGIYWDSTWFVLYRGPGLAVDTIGRYALSEQRGLGGGQPRPYHFGHRMQFALARDRFYMGTSQSFEIGEYALDGSMRRLIRKSHDPSPVTPERRARFREGYAKTVEAEAGQLPPAQLEQVLKYVDEADYPAFVPAYSAMLVDREGNLWVETYRVYTEPESEWTVFDQAGRWLTTVTLPDGLQVKDIGPDYVLGFLRDEVGLDRVALFGLKKTMS